MSLIEQSLAIALRAYAGKTDKAGHAYILHPLRLMAKMSNETEMSVALLHDVIEDSDITAAQLLTEGIPEQVVTAVLCLSKQRNETYQDFVLRAKQNPLARKVKLADIEDNMAACIGYPNIFRAWQCPRLATPNHMNTNAIIVQFLG